MFLNGAGFFAEGRKNNGLEEGGIASKEDPTHLQVLRFEIWEEENKSFHLKGLVEKWCPQRINQAYIRKEGEEHFQRTN